MTIFAIGDVQGCYEALCRLLDRLHFDPSRHRLWFCGDLVNRGTQSLEVLRLVRSLGDRAVSVLGNHDLSFIAQARRTAAERRLSLDLQRIVDAPDGAELIDWLRQRPLLHVDESERFVLVHAGLDPRWTLQTAIAEARYVESLLRGPKHDELLRRLYGDKPGAWSSKLKGILRARAAVNVFTRIRFCDTEGRIAFNCKGPPGSQRPGLYPWFEVPGHARRDYRVVFGHWSALGRFQGMGVFGTDMGCVWGGHLCALRLDEHPRFYQVRARVQDEAVSAEAKGDTERLEFD